MSLMTISLQIIRKGVLVMEQKGLKLWYKLVEPESRYILKNIREIRGISLNSEETSDLGDFYRFQKLHLWVPTNFEKDFFGLLVFCRLHFCVVEALTLLLSFPHLKSNGVS